jgi:hypothetical protein
MTTISDLEKTAQMIVDNIIDHETSINFIAGMMGIGPEVAIAEKFLPMIAGLLQFLQQSTGKPLIEVLPDLMNHITPGEPNLPSLGPPSQDPSAQGSSA